MQSYLIIFFLIICQFSNAQIKQDSVLIEREINEVKISVALFIFLPTNVKA